MLKKNVCIFGVLALFLLMSCYLGASHFVVWNILSARPASCPYISPSETDLVVEKLELRSAGDRLRLAAWLLHPRSASGRVIILIHGFQSFAWDGAAPDISRALLGAGFHVLAFDLRAHGLSAGDLHGLGWHERRDVRAVVDLLVSKGFAPGAIGLHGTSYGAATALLAAAAIDEVGAVVADSAFADIRDIMDREIVGMTSLPSTVVRLLRPGFAFVARHFYGLDLEMIQPLNAVSQIAPRPIFLIHGRDDNIIPAEHSYQLRRSSNNPKNELWIIPQLGHTEAVRKLYPDCTNQLSTSTRSDYLARIVDFYRRVLKPSQTYLKDTYWTEPRNSETLQGCGILEQRAVRCAA